MLADILEPCDTVDFKKNAARAKSKFIDHVTSNFCPRYLFYGTTHKNSVERVHFNTIKLNMVNVSNGGC